MLSHIRTTQRRLWSIFAILMFVPQWILAGQHVVSPAELRKELTEKADAREKNLKQVQEFFRSEPVRKALKGSPTDASKVERAVPALSDEELARLAERTEQIQEDFAAGALSNLHLTYIVIALAAAVLVLVLA